MSYRWLNIILRHVLEFLVAGRFLKKINFCIGYENWLKESKFNESCTELHLDMMKTF